MAQIRLVALTALPRRLRRRLDAAWTESEIALFEMRWPEGSREHLALHCSSTPDSDDRMPCAWADST